MKLIFGEIYAITINPSIKKLIYEGDECLGTYNILTHSVQKKYLTDLLDKLKIHFYISSVGYEKTPKGNFHVHFSLSTMSHSSRWFESTIQNYLNLTPREIVIKFIYCIDGWEQYTQKESIADSAPSSPKKDNNEKISIVEGSQGLKTPSSKGNI